MKCAHSYGYSFTGICIIIISAAIYLYDICGLRARESPWVTGWLTQGHEDFRVCIHLELKFSTCVRTYFDRFFIILSARQGQKRGVAALRQRENILWFKTRRTLSEPFRSPPARFARLSGGVWHLRMRRWPFILQLYSTNFSTEASLNTSEWFYLTYYRTRLWIC